ncbi:MULTISPECIES: secretion protein SctD [unclassified Paraburkholderia]|uniref:secretion protein SctD n=1 Tax=unclassified Paraburkholderia TaxID=2615204 RepID=UPI002AB23669|nr:MULTISPECIES: secretion protein SctD [unclassified Paraburkholderia]
MNTTSTRILRVLTGVHAGAQMRLTPGVYRMSAAGDADVCVSDWSGDALVLTLDEQGVMHLDAGNSDTVLLADLVAVPNGDIVFCIGAEDAAWPSDLDLLSGLWKTQQLVDEDRAQATTHDLPDALATQDAHGLHGEQMAKRMSWRTAAIALTGTVAIGVLATTGAMLAGSQPSEAADQPGAHVDAKTLAVELDAALHREGLHDLHASADRSVLSVRGFVDDANANAKARRIIDALAHGAARRDYDVVQQDVDQIQQSLAGTGAQVSYAGAGVFRVSGTVASMTAFQDRIASVRADLDSNVARLDVDVKEARLPAANVEYTEVVATGGLRYIETPDGTKHLLDGPADGHND